jgi:16S rRNA (cytidine1402-2'-O)-methyltransferase
MPQLTPGRLWLLPVSLGGNAWSIWLPQVAHDHACRITHFIAESAKTARAEIKAMGHPVPMRELHIEEIPRPLPTAAIERLLQPLLAGHDIAIVSEAGCPAVADPGALLVRRAHELGVSVKPLVGPSSLLLTLMASGLDGQQFAFQGYLPARDPERAKRIRELERESSQRKQTQLFIETPYRNLTLFAALLEECQPATMLCVASDLTLESEQIRTRRIRDWRNQPTPELDRRPTVFAFLA